MYAPSKLSVLRPLMTSGALATAITLIAVLVASACSENSASKSVAGPPAIDDPSAAVETNAEARHTLRQRPQSGREIQVREYR